MFQFLNYVHCFLMYLRRNKSKSNKSVLASSSSSISDYVVDLENNYKEAPNVNVTDQGSTIKDNMSGIPYLTVPILGKWIIEWNDNLFLWLIIILSFITS